MSTKQLISKRVNNKVLNKKNVNKLEKYSHNPIIGNKQEGSVFDPHVIKNKD